MPSPLKPCPFCPPERPTQIRRNVRQCLACHIAERARKRKFRDGYCACPGCGKPMAKQASTCAKCCDRKAATQHVGQTFTMAPQTPTSAVMLCWQYGLTLHAPESQDGPHTAAWGQPDGNGLCQPHGAALPGRYGYEVTR